MGIKEKHKQAEEDYYYMTGKYGAPNDLTGGYVVDEEFFELLKKPNRAKAYNLYCDLICYGFNQSPESYVWVTEPLSSSAIDDWHDHYIKNDEIAVQIYDRYC